MQFIIPKKRIWILAALGLDAGGAIHGTVVLKAPDTLAALLDARAVEVFPGVVVDVGHEGVSVEHGEARARVPVRDEQLEGRLVLENLVHGRGRLVHGRGDRGVVRPLVRPVLVVADAVQRVVRVEWRQVQGHGVHQHEDAAAGRVERVEHGEDARRVVCEHPAWDLRVGQERPDPQVVRPNPEGVDG